MYLPSDFTIIVFNFFVHFFEDRTKVKIPLHHLPPLLPTCYEIILDRNGILWVCKRISDASNRDHPFKSSGEGCAHVPMVNRSQYIRIKNPLHKHYAGMPMVGG